MSETETETPVQEDVGTAEPGIAEALTREQEAETPVEETQAEEQWQYTQDQHAQTLAYLEQLDQGMQTLQQFAPTLLTLQNLMQDETPDSGPAVTAPDPFADDYENQFQTAVSQAAEQMLSTRLGPLEQAYQAQTEQQGYQMASQVFDRIAETEGEFDREEAHRRYVFYRQASPDTDPRLALVAAAQESRDLRKRYGDQAVEEYKQSLAQIGQAAREPGAATTGVPATEGMPVPTGSGWGAELARIANAV